jgi:putative transcriptional regulator
MPRTYFTRKRGAHYLVSTQERARLEQRSEKEIEAQALSDPDNPPLTEDQLRRMALSREVRLTREKVGLSQPEFAARFHIGLARLRDLEQGRSEPDLIVRVFLRMIYEDPAGADRLIKKVERHSTVPVS